MSCETAHFRFRTVWSLPQPGEVVWRALETPTSWPRWWPGCLIVEPLAPAPPQRPGRCFRFHWRGALPYRLVMDVRIDESEPAQRMTGQVDGVLAGTAEWTLWREADETRVGFDFSVSGRQPWMAHMASLARPLFRWNHEGLMARGEAGLRRWLSQPQQGVRAGRLQTGTR